MTSRWLRTRGTMVALGGLVLAVCLGTGTYLLFLRGNEQTTIAPPAAPGAQHIDYTLKDSLVALVQAADLICECTVLSVSSPYSATPRVDAPGGSAPAASPAQTVQDYEMRVDRAFRTVGDAPTAVTVVQAGNRGDPRNATEDQPLLVGSRYVLFLRKSSSGKYGFVSGPQGRLLVNAANRLQPALTGDAVSNLLRNRSLEQLPNLLKSLPH